MNSHDDAMDISQLLVARTRYHKMHISSIAMQQSPCLVYALKEPTHARVGNSQV